MALPGFAGVIELTDVISHGVIITPFVFVTLVVNIFQVRNIGNDLRKRDAIVALAAAVVSSAFLWLLRDHFIFGSTTSGREIIALLTIAAQITVAVVSSIIMLLSPRLTNAAIYTLFAVAYFVGIAVFSSVTTLHDASVPDGDFTREGTICIGDTCRQGRIVASFSRITAVSLAGSGLISFFPTSEIKAYHMAFPSGLKAPFLDDANSTSD